MSLSRNATGREFQTSRDTVHWRKNSSLRDALVFFLWHTSRHQPIAVIGPMSVKSWQSSARYCGTPCAREKGLIIKCYINSSVYWFTFRKTLLMMMMIMMMMQYCTVPGEPTERVKTAIILMSSGDSVYLLDESLELWRDMLLARTTVVPLAPPCGLRLTFGEGTGTLLQFRSCSWSPSVLNRLISLRANDENCYYGCRLPCVRSSCRCCMSDRVPEDHKY